MFNRLAYNRGYLCGPMDRVKDGGVEWRDYIKKALRSLKVLWLDPCNKPIDIAIETPEVRAHLLHLKREGQFEDFGAQMHTIAAVDLRMVHISDFLVVNLDLNVHAAGTYEEFTWANQQKKPIIIRCAQGKHEAPSWIFGRIPHEMIFSTWDEVIDYLNHVAYDPIVKTFDRWYFFNFTGENE